MNDTAAERPHPPAPWVLAELEQATMGPKYVPEEAIRQRISIEQVIPAVEQAFRDYQQGKIVIGQRSTMQVRVPDNDCLFLPSVHLEAPYYAIKHAASFPGNPAKGLPTVVSQICVYSAQSGELLAIMEANHLTALKTGAAAAVAAKHLAQADSRSALIIGAGEQAKTQLSALLTSLPLQKIDIMDLNPDRAEGFRRWAMETLPGAPSINSVAAVGDSAAQADIIVTCTTSAQPVLKGESLKPGVHINAIGSFTPGMQEIDSDAVLRADLIVTDQIQETWQNAGDLLKPLNDGLIDRHAIGAELGEIVCGLKPGRTDAGQITLYESIGFAALDLAVAIMVNETVQGQ